MAKPEQAVLVFWKLSGDGFGEFDEREAVFELEDRLEEAVKNQKAGEYDGHEFGEGWGKLYMYGPDARRLADIVVPVLREVNPPAGSYVVRRFGGPGAQEERIAL